jgi:two-component system phosphate regulon sensor histidine kinase PhoR
MTGKIFRYSFLLGVLVLLICGGLFFALQYRQNLDETAQLVQDEMVFLAEGVENGGVDYLKNLSTERELTWINAEGTVRYDNHYANLPDQSDLPEVRDALASGSGSDSRKAANGERTYYYAVALSDGSVLRLSCPVNAAQSALATVSPVLWVLILVVAFSGVVAFRAAKQIIQPINEMDLDHPDQIRTYPELSPLVDRLQEQRLTIDDQIEELHRKQKEFSALTDNMAEGFLLLDKEGKVLSLNASTRQRLGENLVGENVLNSGDPIVADAAYQALKGQRSDLVFSENEHSWQLIASPVYSHRKIVGAVLLRMDVTEREQRERLRQEFSANISHELKTPLTSISGFAELMAQGTVPPDKVAEFSADIHREAQRLIDLVPLAASPYTVQCSNTERFPIQKTQCDAGCRGCGVCAKNCPSGAIQMENNLARIDYSKCTGCGTCAQKCPAGCISFHDIPVAEPESKVS